MYPRPLFGRRSAQSGRYGPIRLGMTFTLILALLTGLGYLSWQLLETLWDRATGYVSPYTADLTVPAGEEPEALTPAVVLIVVDGLRADASFEMAALAELRAAGVSTVAQTEQPSLSLPGGATIGTGAGPPITGVTTNWYEGPIKTDSLFAALDRVGLPAAFVGWEGWVQLYGEWLVQARSPQGEKGTGEHDRAVFETAAGWLAEGAPPGLTVVYFSETDETGHRHGGASAEYLDEVRRVGGYVAEILDLIDLSRATVFVTADHGHTDGGGHGGPEPEVTLVPLVAAGVGIKGEGPKLTAWPEGGYGAGLSPGLYQVDIAPTIAALLGAPVPAHAIGIHRGEWLAADQTWLARRLILAAEARNRLSTLLTGLGRGEHPELLAQAQNRLAAGDPEGAAETAEAFIAAEEAERGKVMETVAAAERADRLPAVIAIGLSPILLMLIMARPPRSWTTWLAAGLFWVAFYLLFSHIHGFSYSFSAFNEEAQIKAWGQARIVEGAVLMIVTAVLAGFLTRDADHGVRASAGLGAVWASFSVMYLLAANVLWFYYREGFAFGDRLPDFVAGFRVLVYLMTATGAGLASVPGLLLTLAAAGLGAPRPAARVGRMYR